jgi:nifR3 family TIM-barrel protein
MSSNFWRELKRPFFILAPMADVTDAAFRRIIAKYGKPDVTYTEFVSADGICLADKEGREKLIKDLLYSEEERPIVAQFFTSKPELMKKAAALAVEMNFDGVDINMGCPDRSIEKQGAGAALIKNQSLAVELIEAAKEGVGGKIPVSVKTRTGYNKDEIDIWIPKLLSAEPDALIIHARTRKEMSKVSAHWDDIRRVVDIRDNINSGTLIVGNGDVLNIGEAKRKVKEFGCDGVMLGRAIFGNPWLFAEKEVSVEEKLKVMIEHTKLFEELLGGVKNFAVMKKHYKAYANGFDGAKELRIKLMETQNGKEVEGIVEDFLSSIDSKGR